jgi:hypothetical protein
VSQRHLVRFSGVFIEHIQSGARQRVSKLADDLPWMEEAAATKPPAIAINDED